ncbi:MAG: threonine synthase, partial [Planctomycetota bacterium]|nr:threonine synthase [Planctomycetota bacterium]
MSEVLSTSPDDDGLLDIAYDWDRVAVPSTLREFESRWANRHNPLDFSGVWR